MTIENLAEVASELRERSRSTQGLPPVVEDDRMLDKVVGLMRRDADEVAS